MNNKNQPKASIIDAIAVFTAFQLISFKKKKHFNDLNKLIEFHKNEYIITTHE